MKKLAIIAVLLSLSSCAVVKDSVSFNRSNVIIETIEQTWLYDKFSERTYYKGLRDEGLFDAKLDANTYFHKYLINEQGTMIDLQNDIYALQRDGSYRHIDVDVTETPLMRLFNDNGRLRVSMSRMNMYTQDQPITDCDLDEGGYKNFLIGSIDIENRMIKFDEVYLGSSPDHAELMRWWNRDPEDAPEVMTRPFNCG